MKVEKGKRVKMEYELKLSTGEVIESSANRGPIEYVHGVGKMLPGLEKCIEGMVAGEEKNGTISGADALGPQTALPTMVLTKKEFPEGETIEMGKTFQAKDPSGSPIQFTVVKIENEQITVRFDHPLAGKDIEYKVKILEIVDPN